MTPTIHVLDQHSANQIAAGEVVERPVSVVKELIENSLDAGARKINIIIEENGLPLIRVEDDGCGINSNELTTALLRHATSKIKTIDDLNSLSTLGFRGEALPSIASVSLLEISSRSAEDISGTYIKFKGGKFLEKNEIGIPIGTTVTVRDLFYNTPARKKFLKSKNTEFGLISDIVGRLSIARPDVAFSLTHPQQVIIQTSGRGQLLESTGAVLGNNIARQLIEVSYSFGEWSLHGYISPPSLVRSTKNAETFIVNDRYIKSNFLSRSLRDAYHTLIPSKLYPIAVLHLHIPPMEYDVNVHPTKMDIRFQREKELGEFITKNLYNALIANYSIPKFKTNNSSVQRASQTKEINKDISFHDNLSVPKLEKKINKYTTINTPNDFVIEKTENTKNSLEGKIEPLYNHNKELIKHYYANQGKFKQNKEKVRINNDKINSSKEVFNLFSNLDKDKIIQDQDEIIHSSNYVHLWPLAQIFNTYILCTDGKMLILIDQHAAHERINYEKILNKIKKRKANSQTLIIPISVEFSTQEEQALLEQLWVLREMGFILEHFGPRTYLLRGVPDLEVSIAPEEMLNHFIEEVLNENNPPSFDKLIEKWIYSLACKESIKAKENLSLSEMEQLISTLYSTDNPYTCPHGRPTMIQITKQELEKRFYRT